MKILLVENEHLIANFIKRGFEQEKFDIEVIYDGAKGLDLASTKNYDVIILDSMIPGIDGTTICKKLRVNNNHTPILILAAKGTLNEKAKCLNSGVDDYLSKPFAFQELLSHVCAMINTNPNQILACEDLSFNTFTFEVKRGNEIINLSKKEFSLLEYLMKHPNQVVTKDQLISYAWDYDTAISNNAVEVYIGYLRNKIDRKFKNKRPLIQTLRGFGGYKLAFS